MAARSEKSVMTVACWQQKMCIRDSCLHRGHHTGQPHHIRVIGVVDGLELHTGSYEPFQLGKAFESDRLSLLF